MKIYKKSTSAKGYYEAKRGVTERIVKKLSRGNVNIQNGFYMSRSKLDAKSKAADEAMRRTKKLVGDLA